jgi:hypothetical protein
MRTKILQCLGNLHHRLSQRRRWLLAAGLGTCLIAEAAWPDGIGDILSLFQTITHTLQGPIGGALGEMQKVSTAINSFRQQIIWPPVLINQTRSFISATRSRYTRLMFQIEGIRNNSATLGGPMKLESLFRSAQAGSITQIPPIYMQVYQPVSQAGLAQPLQRNLMDIDDAMAMDSLKTAMVSDQNTKGMLTLADSIEQQAMSAAPGSAAMVTAQARVADLETQAQLAKILAAQLRQEATKLAHQNAVLKQHSVATQNLQNQIQQVLIHP